MYLKKLNYKYDLSHNNIIPKTIYGMQFQLFQIPI